MRGSSPLTRTNGFEIKSRENDVELQVLTRHVFLETPEIGVDYLLQEIPRVTLT